LRTVGSAFSKIRGTVRDAPLAPDRHLVRVAAERADVLAHPVEREALVVQAEVDVALGAKLARREEAERRDAVVDLDVDLQGSRR